jgi:thiol:disulfide interchange protein DsbD
MVNEMYKSLFIALSAIILLLSCGKKYDEFRAVPVPGNLEIVPGREYILALKIEIPSGQHIYGNPKGPGTGKPTVLSYSRDDRFYFREPQYLPAKKYTASGDKDFVWIYEHETYMFLPFSAKKDTAPGEYILKLSLDSLLCMTGTCVPKFQEFSYPVRVVRSGGTASVDASVLDKFNDSKPSEPVAIIKTPVDQGNRDGLEAIEFQPVYMEGQVTGLAQAIIFGFLAGFILNFMPCVLPVVSLKVMGFVKQAEKNRSDSFKMGILFSAGIMTSFFTLAVLAAYFGYSWGGLFQRTGFLIAMIALVFALAMSMFDLFIVNVPSFLGRHGLESENPYLDSYFKGLLATLLATPCSGPFLGGTLAWTLSRPPAVIFTVFISIGVGMAIPYIILSADKRLIRFIPRPGNWMKNLERVMGFLLIFTAIYLIGILETAYILPTMTFLGIFAAGLWQYGIFGAIDQTALKRIISSSVLVLLIIGGYYLSFNYLYVESRQEFKKNLFSADRLLANRETGRITVVDFTADWCPNCRYVEKTALFTKNVSEAMNKKNIDFIVADLTKKNPQAEVLLAKLGSKSIPFLAIFPSGGSFANPVCLRDIYSEADVISAIEKTR